MSSKNKPPIWLAQVRGSRTIHGMDLVGNMAQPAWCGLAPPKGKEWSSVRLPSGRPFDDVSCPDCRIARPDYRSRAEPDPPREIKAPDDWQNHLPLGATIEQLFAAAPAMYEVLKRTDGALFRLGHRPDPSPDDVHWWAECEACQLAREIRTVFMAAGLWGGERPKETP